ncbi:MAG: hypothetical protein WC665_03320 [Sulfurimonas sp.]|jgi:hypothetical protein
MNKNLGRFFYLFLALWHVEIFASTYVWHVEADKKAAFVNEAIYLKYSCKFSDRAELYSIDFNPVSDNEEYSLRLLSQTTKIEDGKKIALYEFVAFAKRAGEVKFDFDMAMKKSNHDSIENMVIGRDNMQREQFSITLVHQESVAIEVKETLTDLFGSLDMQIKKDELKVKAYEPFHMEITLKGVGNFDALKPYDLKIEGVKVFSQKPTENVTLTKDGLSGEWTQKFAFVGDKDFEIPATTFKYFDKNEQKIREIHFEAIKVEVSKAFTKEELIEADENEKSFLKLEHLYYLLTFIAGFLASKIKIKKSVIYTKDEIFLNKIQNAKSLEELCVLLALKDSKKYSDIILKIEKKEISSLTKAKKILSLLMDN